MLFTQKLHSDLMVCGDSTLCNYNIRSDNAVCNIIYLSGQEVLGGETPWTFPPIEEMLCGNAASNRGSEDRASVM